MKKLIISLLIYLIPLAVIAQEGKDACQPLPISDNPQLDGIGWISYLPFIIGVIVFTLLFRKFSNFSLKDALSTDHDPANKIPSASRLVAFISGISAILFSFCLFVFYTTVYIRTGCYPEIENLTNSLIALGIGVIPYSINKVAGAIERRGKFSTSQTAQYDSTKTD